MALSTCSNLGNYLHVDHNSATDELLACNDENNTNNLTFSDAFINPFYELDELLCPDTYSNFLPFFASPPANIMALSPEEFEYPKLQKSNVNHYQSNLVPKLLEGPVPEYLLPEIPAEEPKFVPFNIGRTDENNVKKAAGAVRLSAQSIAARERRRKITEKTQELGKLIPGGTKMNTAQMFQAASNYVKFLQAQVGILQLMASIQENKEESTKELQTLLTSTTIQERLYSEEKCLVRMDFVQTLANNHEIQSSFITKDIDQLLHTDA